MFISVIDWNKDECILRTDHIESISKMMGSKWYRIIYQDPSGLLHSGRKFSITEEERQCYHKEILISAIEYKRIRDFLINSATQEE
jgi:hypothetical protein